MTCYDITLTEDGKWWMITAPDAISGATQARHFGEVDEMARSWIAVTLDVAPAEIDIQLVEVESACPNCDAVLKRSVYDIGSGPELSCVNCEWCWGALGQSLKPVDTTSFFAALKREGGFDPS